MNYEQTKHKINKNEFETDILKNKIEKIDFKVELLELDSLIKKIYFLQTDWANYNIRGY